MSENPVIDVIDQGHYAHEGKCELCKVTYPCLTVEAARSIAAQRSNDLVVKANLAKSLEQRKLFV